MAAGPALKMWSRDNQKANSPDGLNGTLSITEAYTVTIAADDRLEVIYSSAGLPLLGDLYPGTFAVQVVDLNPQRVSPILAIVQIEYFGEIKRDSNSGSPIDNGYSISWGGVTTDEAIDEDWNGKAIVTANGESIDGLTERLTDDIVTITRNYLTVNRYAVRAYRRATNSDTFLGWPPGTARLVDDVADAVFINGTLKYWKVRAVIQFREPFRTTADKAWYKRVRHEGIYVRDVAGGPTRPAWDETGKAPATKPVLLNEDGTEIPRSDASIGGTVAHWLLIQTLGSLPFNALGLV